MSIFRKDELSIKIRKGTIKDISSIARIQKRDPFEHSYYLTTKRLKELFKRGEMFFVAILENRIVGFTSLYIEIRAELHFLSVTKKHIGKGIGSALLYKALNEAKKHGKDILYVYTETKSLAERFLVKRGFQKIGYFNDRFGKGKHANILGISLSQWKKKSSKIKKVRI